MLTPPPVDERLEMSPELQLRLVLALLVLGALRLGGVELLEVSWGERAGLVETPRVFTSSNTHPCNSRDARCAGR